MRSQELSTWDSMSGGEPVSSAPAPQQAGGDSNWACLILAEE